MQTVEMTPDQLVEELIQNRVLDRSYTYRSLQAFRKDNPFGEAKEFGEFLLQLGQITSYQLGRLLAGEGKRLVVGPYQILNILGRGSLGPAYRAMGRADRGSYVLKVLPLHNQWNIRLARRQTELMSELNLNERIVPFLDVGNSNDQHYLVWPLVEGKTLDKWVMEKGPMPPEEVALLGIQIAETLSICHNIGLVHGFIKPSNVMIGTDKNAKLLDWGVGAILSENNEKFESMLDTISMAVALANMFDCIAPEYALEPETLSALADQYSLGCVLYYTATGTFPFATGTMMDKIYAHQKKSAKPIHQLDPRFPVTLQEIIDRLMSKSPQKRYRRWKDFIEDIRPFATNQFSDSPSEAIGVDIQTPLPSKKPRVLDLLAANVSIPAKTATPLNATPLKTKEGKTANVAPTKSSLSSNQNDSPSTSNSSSSKKESSWWQKLFGS